jgi:hypothetical protein
MHVKITQRRQFLHSDLASTFDIRSSCLQPIAYHHRIKVIVRLSEIAYTSDWLFSFKSITCWRIHKAPSLNCRETYWYGQSGSPDEIYKPIDRLPNLRHLDRLWMTLSGCESITDMWIETHNSRMPNAPAAVSFRHSLRQLLKHARVALQ